MKGWVWERISPCWRKWASVAVPTATVTWKDTLPFTEDRHPWGSSPSPNSCFPYRLFRVGGFFQECSFVHAETKELILAQPTHLPENSLERNSLVRENDKGKMLDHDNPHPSAKPSERQLVTPPWEDQRVPFSPASCWKRPERWQLRHQWGRNEEGQGEEVKAFLTAYRLCGRKWGLC